LRRKHQYCQSISHAMARTGSVSPEKFGGYKGYVLEPHRRRIERWGDRQPDITLSELQARLAEEEVVVSQTAIFRFLRHLEFTLKKKAYTLQNKTGRTWPQRVGHGSSCRQVSTQDVSCLSTQPAPPRT
jgi:transposase